MAYLIVTDNCTACGACEPECPNAAISHNKKSIYKIDPNLCTECIGHFKEPQCAAVCPVDLTCIPNPSLPRYQAL